MRDHGGDAIINTGSGANKAPFPNLGDYCASKGGIERLTVVSAVELGPLDESMLCWPGRKPPVRRVEKRISNGDRYNASSWELSAHSGTRLDAPLHFVEGVNRLTDSTQAPSSEPVPWSSRTPFLNATMSSAFAAHRDC